MGLRLVPDLVALGPGSRRGRRRGRLARAIAAVDPGVVRKAAMLNTEREPGRRGGGDVAVRRAVAADIDAMAAQLAKTFWDDPVAAT